MQFRDLQTQYQNYKKEIDSAIQNVLLQANFIEGREVSELEEQLADYTGVRNCITCANGTDAMSLILMAWGIREGDAVFVPDFTFFSTGEVVALAGATPVFVDVDKDTFNIDCKKLEKEIQRIITEGKLTPKAMIPVDLFGLPADHPEIDKIAQKYHMLVLEDAAQGFGGSINGQRACSFGNAAATSFFPAKPLGCYGDGGAVFTNDDHLAVLLRSLKVHGKGSCKYDNVRVGLNSRLDTIQAAILLVKLRAFVSHELHEVNNIQCLYRDKLKDVVEIPYLPEGYYSSFAQYSIKLENNKQREELQQKLRERGIPSMVYYSKPMHKQDAFRGLEYDENNFSVTNRLCDIILSLPMHPYLTEEDINEICNVIIDYIGC